MTVRKILAIMTAVLLLCSCEKESLRNLFSTQETRIETLVNAQLSANEDYEVVYNDGSTRLVVAHGEGDSLAGDMIVSFYYAGYVLTGSSLPASSALFATNSEDVATAARWNLTPELEDDEGSGIGVYEPYTVRLSDAGFVDGLARGLQGVQGGEECWIFFTGRLGFGDKKLGTIPANSACAYHIWVHSVQNDEI